MNVMTAAFDQYVKLFPKNTGSCRDVLAGGIILGGGGALATGHLVGMPDDAPSLYFAPFFALSFPLALLVLAWLLFAMSGLLSIIEWPIRATWKAIAQRGDAANNSR